jgi:Ser/Thr protein kinase RdoA (MazF antagonist)
VRRTRSGRDVEFEAAIMRHAASHGVPVPKVFDVDGPDMLMERIDGPTMSEDVMRRPDRLRDHALTLAELHRLVGAVTAPGWLPEPDGTDGDQLLHLDLHPLNVLITDDGPTVIDWTNARRGAAGIDAANTWLLMATADVPAELAGAVQEFLDVFLDRVGRETVAPYLGIALECQRRDPNKKPAELDRMDDVVASESR